MAMVLTPATTQTTDSMELKEGKGLRKALRKWKDRLRSPKKDQVVSHLQPQAEAQSQRQSQAQSPSQSKATAPSPKIDNPFAPTTQTTISSPNDRRNSRASPPSAFTRRPNPRRNTAPADYFATQQRASSLPTTPSATQQPTPDPLLNTITTTISATTPPPKPRLRSRFSLRLSKAPSFQHPHTQDLQLRPPHQQPVSPAPSAPNPLDHPNRRATFQFTTAAEIAAQTAIDAEKLRVAAQVIRRDKPKDWMDPGWREKEEREVERLRGVLEEEGREVGDVKLRVAGGGGGDGPLKKWEWGR